jgi:hypothetical protein
MENCLRHICTTPPTHFGYVRVGESIFIFLLTFNAILLPPQLYFVSEAIFQFSLHVIFQGFTWLQPLATIFGTIV